MSYIGLQSAVTFLGTGTGPITVSPAASGSAEFFRLDPLFPEVLDLAAVPGRSGCSPW
jgi:hypothetical protein